MQSGYLDLRASVNEEQAIERAKDGVSNTIYEGVIRQGLASGHNKHCPYKSKNYARTNHRKTIRNQLSKKT